MFFLGPLGVSGGAPETEHVNISLHVEQTYGLGGGCGGGAESKNVNISLYLEQTNVLGGGWLVGPGEQEHEYFIIRRVKTRSERVLAGGGDGEHKC